MGSIIHYQNDIFKSRLDYSEYWDFVIDTHGEGLKQPLSYCPQSMIDFGNPDCVNLDYVTSIPDYIYNKGVNKGLILHNFGYTGVDNGRLTFQKDAITNEDFIQIYTNSKFELEKDNLSVIMYPVKGNNQIFDYPYSYTDGPDGQVVQLNGGFFQCFYKTDGCDYQVLPNDIEDGLSLSFDLCKSDLEKESEHTLNDKYPSNKGIFFYWGTRAENKWWKLYDVEHSFESTCPDYIVDGYVNDEYLLDAYTDTLYIKELSEPEEPEATEPYDDPYMDGEYLHDNYLEWTEQIIDNESVNVHEELPVDDCKQERYKLTLPEFLNTYQDNSIWFNDKKGVMIENDVLTTRKKCPCISNPVISTPNCDWTLGEYVDSEYYSTFCEDNSSYCELDYFKKDVELPKDDYLTTVNGFLLSQPNVKQYLTDNKFLLFDRTPDGFNVHNWEEDFVLEITETESLNQENYFLLMSKQGYNVHNIADYKQKHSQKYNVYKDLYNNAFALQIQDDGSIGYKYLVKDCEGGNDYKIISQYSKPNVIKNDKWHHIEVRFKKINNKYMRLLFFVDNKLKFVSNELEHFNFRKLNDLYEKQEGVPFNVSLGGGTQGLCDVVYADFYKNPDNILPLESEFGGSFIGYIKSFTISTYC